MTAKTRRFAFLCSFLWDHTFWIFMLPGLDNSWQVLQDSNFSEIAFKLSTSASITVSPNSVLTGVSSTSDMEINISESGTDNPCSHLEIVCRTTFRLIASSCWESPFDFLIALIFSLSIKDSLLSFRRYRYCSRNRPLPQATRLNIFRKWRF